MLPTELITQVSCPYCAEMIEIHVDVSQGESEYVEDCQVCCRPMSVQVRHSEQGDPMVETKR